jgi:hypothetical protein
MGRVLTAYPGHLHVSSRLQVLCHGGITGALIDPGIPGCQYRQFIPVVRREKTDVDGINYELTGEERD